MIRFFSTCFQSKPNLELCLTKEIYNEIDRAEDMAEIQRYRKLAQVHHEIATDDVRVQSLIPELQKLIQWENSASGESDLRQIANTIAGGIQVFVTRDQQLRSQGDLLYENFNLTVLYPTELINQLDRKSTRLNSSHLGISYAVFCLKKKKNKLNTATHKAPPRRCRRAQARDVGQ